MLKEAIEKILSLSTPSIDEINGIKYSDKKLNIIEQPPFNKIQISSLKSLVDYANDFNERVKKVFILVETYNFVKVITKATNEERKCHTVATCLAKSSEFPIEHYLPSENFIVHLKENFVYGQNIKDIIKVVGNTMSTSSIKTNDDGISQSVEVKSGVVSVKKVEIGQIITLNPYRTFNEIDQPNVEYFIRAKKDKDGNVLWALFEIKDKIWESLCVENIKEFIEPLCEDVEVI